ncbi:glycosyltransferase [Halomonas organivorans]|uniref:Tetratricopeptide (TPR) repeat protein n=1 Tax=Halomonas organivorans TaxID=257772 RepID=A0A7W5C0R9_9GAMM|nr:glycosyltransferase [Halomonas organivorans]MBB3142634.1 tetratricopeptide (TPR) repeat protein [Halomonas organivorans]
MNMINDTMKGRPSSLQDTVNEIPDLLQQAQQAMAEADLERAETLIDEALRQPSRQARRLWVRVALQQDRLESAQARVATMLQADPRDPVLRALEAQIQRREGHPRQALQIINQAIPEWPKNIQLKLLKLRFLQDLGRSRPALALVRRLRRRWPEHPGVLMAVAQFYRDHGHFRASRLVLEHLLAHHPEHQPARLLNRALTYSRTSDDTNAPLAELVNQLAQRDELSQADTGELLHAIKLCPLQKELIKGCQDGLSRLDSQLDMMKEQEKFLLFSQAERFGMADIAHRALEALLETGPRSPQVARRLFLKAIACGVSEHDMLISRLLRHIAPDKRGLLEAEFLLHTQGPKDAWARLMQEHRPRRSRVEVQQLVPLLRTTHDRALCLRYLRFCRRRWPRDAELRLQHANLLVEAGYPGRALSVLKAPVPANKRLLKARIRASCLLETGQIDAAKAEMERVGHYGEAQGALHCHLGILLMLGHEEDAQAFLEQAQRGNQNQTVTSGHFSISSLGMQLNDLKMFHREQASLTSLAPQSPGKHDAYLVAHYVYPARQVIQRNVRYKVAAGERGTRHIPRRVVQFWNDRRPPHSVAEIMQSWSSVPGIDYQRFNTLMARDFLRHHLGADYERAFRLANNIAESVDFFRLCYLRHHGGIYADADDRLSGRLEALIPPDVGLVCFRENYGALANNVIIAAPEHPAIVLASEMALEALLARDNESTWSKTGPGLLTRAVASHLLRGKPERPEQRVAILPSYLLRRQVHIHIPLPHKKTGQYWNAANTTGVDLRPFFSDHHKSA